MNTTLPDHPDIESAMLTGFLFGQVVTDERPLREWRVPFGGEAFVEARDQDEAEELARNHLIWDHDDVNFCSVGDATVEL